MEEGLGRPDGPAEMRPTYGSRESSNQHPLEFDGSEITDTKPKPLDLLPELEELKNVAVRPEGAADRLLTFIILKC